MNRISSLALVMAGLMVGTSLNAAASDGAAAWVKEYPQADGSPARSCATCHTADLTKAGKHAVTGKAIEPMAPSVNAQRLTDPAKIEKWFKRNCRWTMGRECTPAEKTQFVNYIKSQ